MGRSSESNSFHTYLMLVTAAETLSCSGVNEVFTKMYFFLTKKKKNPRDGWDTFGGVFFHKKKFFSI